MAFKHIQSNRTVFLLSREGIPTGKTIAGELAPAGSLCIDRSQGEMYILTPGGVWKKFGNVSESTPIREEFSASAGTGTQSFTLSYTPEPDTLIFYVNSVPSFSEIDFNLSANTITWLGTSYDLDENDQIVAFYRTGDFSV